MSFPTADSALFLDPRQREFEWPVYKLAFGGPQNSIPDRIRRGAELIRDLTQSGALKANDKILILGAGATGIAVACTAHKLGIVPVVIDYRQRFALQAGCTTRFIHPNQYSWPDVGFEIPNWDEVDLNTLDEYQFNNPYNRNPLLPWQAARADKIAQQWESWFINFNEKGNRIDVKLEPSLSGLLDSHPDDPRNEIRKWITESGNKDYDAVIIAKSHRHEIVALNDYQGFAFWETDPFEDSDYGLPHGGPPEIVISGGGNGGLQDYIRIVTGRQAYEVLEEMRIAYDHNANSEFEDNFKDEFDLKKDYEEFKNVIEPVIDYVQSDTKRRALVDNLIKFPFRGGSLTLNHRGWAFGSDAYALNVWLVLLLSRYLEKTRKVITLLPGVSGSKDKSKETRVTVDPCSAKSGAWRYHGCKNVVHVTLLERGGPTEVSRKLNANILVVRHGIYPFLNKG